MPYRRKDSPYWWISYTDASGKQVSRSSRTANWREAKTIEHELRAESSRVKNQITDKTFDDVLLAFLQANPSARRGYAVKGLSPFFSGIAISSITPATINMYKRQRGVSVGTQARELRVFSAAINWVNRELDWGLPNPIAGRAPKEQQHRVRWITRDEASTLIAAAGPNHLKEFIRLALNTGMRRGEILRLEWDRVDLRANLVYLTPMDQKGRRDSSVPLNSEARGTLLRLADFRASECPASRWVFCGNGGSRIGSVKKSFATACRRAGIEDFTPHDLRHTCAAWLVQAGVPIRTVAEILRHRDIRTTMRYAHLAPEDARAGVAALERSNSRSTELMDHGKRSHK